MAFDPSSVHKDDLTPHLVSAATHSRIQRCAGVNVGCRKGSMFGAETQPHLPRFPPLEVCVRRPPRAPPYWAMAAEDIRNLQSRARHKRRASAGWPDLFELEREMFQRAQDLADRLGGDVSIERGRLKLRVTEQHLDDANIDFLLEQMGSEAVPQDV